MGKKGKRKGYYPKQKEPVYGSDDERAYLKEKQPNPDAEDFIYDEIDEFHVQKNKILLESSSGIIRPEKPSAEDEEEVMGLDVDDDEGGMSSDDLEGQEDDGDPLPDPKAWGTKKRNFFNADYEDLDIAGQLSESEEELAEAEEEAAREVEERMAQAITEDDFGLDLITKSAKEINKEQVEDQKVIKDLSKLSKKDKIELLKSESPEFFELVEDFKSKLTEIIDVLCPLLNLVKQGIIEGKGAIFVKTKYQLYLKYCMNIGFYMVLKARRQTPVHTHPVINRLVSYRNLIKQLEPVDNKLAPEIKGILIRQKEVNRKTDALTTRRQNTKDILSENADEIVMEEKKKSKKRKMVKISNLLDHNSDEEDSESGFEDEREEENVIINHGKKIKKKKNASLTPDEQEAFKYYKEVKKMKETKAAEYLKQNMNENESDIKPDDDDADAVGKRAITYKISKNKGLTPKRKREQRNPRVKHRMKYKKAQIKRKGQVKSHRPELQPYAGEASGIRMGLIRSIKLK